MDGGQGGRQRSKKIVLLRVGNRITDKGLADIKREMVIAARAGDTSVVVDLQALTEVDSQTADLFHRTVAETISPKRVTLFNVSLELARLLDEMQVRSEYDTVMEARREETEDPEPDAGEPEEEEPEEPVRLGRPRPPADRTEAPPPPPAPAPPARPARAPGSDTGIRTRPSTTATPTPAAPVVKLFRKTQPPGADPAGLAGKQFLNLKIGEEIGRGGLATVYRADEEHSGRIFALKVLHPWYAESKNIVDQFLAEGNLGKRLDNEHLVKVYGCGRHGKVHYNLLEWVPSVSVLDLISATGAIEERLAVGIVIDVASALDYLETNAVIHGDVKPGNILVKEDGHAKLCDFGQAVRMDLDPDMGEGGDNFGTPGYTAPERQYDRKTSDPRGEIYSLGITLYRMVAGIKPGVSGKIPLQPLHPQFLSDNAISATIRYFIARMTVLDVNLRYSGAREALKELKKHQIGGREFKRDMTVFGEDYVQAYRNYAAKHGTRRQQKSPGKEPQA